MYYKSQSLDIRQVFKEQSFQNSNLQNPSFYSGLEDLLTLTNELDSNELNVLKSRSYQQIQNSQQWEQNQENSELAEHQYFPQIRVKQIKQTIIEQSQEEISTKKANKNEDTQTSSSSFLMFPSYMESCYLKENSKDSLKLAQNDNTSDKILGIDDQFPYNYFSEQDYLALFESSEEGFQGELIQTSSENQSNQEDNQNQSYWPTYKQNFIKIFEVEKIPRKQMLGTDLISQSSDCSFTVDEKRHRGSSLKIQSKLYESEKVQIETQPIIYQDQSINSASTDKSKNQFQQQKKQIRKRRRRTNIKYFISNDEVVSLKRTCMRVYKKIFAENVENFKTQLLKQTDYFDGVTDNSLVKLAEIFAHCTSENTNNIQQSQKGKLSSKLMAKSENLIKNQNQSQKQIQGESTNHQVQYQCLQTQTDSINQSEQNQIYKELYDLIGSACYSFNLQNVRNLFSDSTCNYIFQKSITMEMERSGLENLLYRSVVQKLHQDNQNAKAYNQNLQDNQVQEGKVRKLKNIYSQYEMEMREKQLIAIIKEFLTLAQSIQSQKQDNH
eukprot:403355586